VALRAHFGRKASVSYFIIVKTHSFDAYKKGVGAPVLKGSVGAIVLGSKGSGGGIKSFTAN